MIRNLLLLAVSLAFYAVIGSPALVGVLLAVAVGTFLVGRGLSAGRSRALLALGVGANLAVLAACKLAAPELGALGLGGELAAALASASTIGVSYFVLQAIAYLVDVQRGQAEPEREPVGLTLSLAFFPKLLQGPIERPSRLIPQLRAPWRFDYDSWRSGLLLIAVGLAKKLVVADTLAPFVTNAFAVPEAYHGLPLLLALYTYALQIYFDFSGYTDIALGVARLLGVELTDNFDRPYWASSIAEFWRRWHITLSSWLRDYLFLPIAYATGRTANRLELRPRAVEQLSYAAAALGTMVLCGLWHGATLGFLVWGALHGAYMVGSHLTRKLRQRLWRLAPPVVLRARGAVAVAVTFHLVALAWVFFRAGSLSSAWRYLASLAAVGGTSSGWGLVDWLSLLPAYLGAGLWLALERGPSKGELIRRLTTLPPLPRWAVYYAIVLALLLFSVSGSQTFMYFRF